MERVLCKDHCRPCILKTGVSGGRSDGVSFYMCSNFKNRCNFVQMAEDVLPMTCPLHGEVVSMRVWDSKNPQRITYFCSKKTSSKCGSMMVSDTQNEKENLDPEIGMTVEKSDKIRKYVSLKTPAFPHTSSMASDMDSEPDSGIKSTDSAQQDRYMYNSGHDTPLDNTCSDKSSPSYSSSLSPPVVRALVMNTDEEEGACSSTDSPDKLDTMNMEVAGEEQSPAQPLSPYIIPEPPSTTELSMLSVVSLEDEHNHDTTHPSTSISLPQGGTDECEIIGEESDSINSTFNSASDVEAIVLDDNHHFGDDSESILYKSALEFLGSDSKTNNKQDDGDTSISDNQSGMKESTEDEAEEVSCCEENTNSPPSSPAQNNPSTQHVIQTLSYRDSTYQYDSDSDDENSTTQNSDSVYSVSTHSSTSTGQSSSPMCSPSKDSPLKSLTSPSTNSEPQPHHSSVMVIPDKNATEFEASPQKSYQNSSERVVNPLSASVIQRFSPEQSNGSGNEDASSEDIREHYNRSEHLPVDVQQSVSPESCHGADDEVSFKTSPNAAPHKSPELNSQPILIESSSIPKVSPPNTQLAQKEQVKEKEEKAEPEFKVGYQARTLIRQYEQVELLIRTLSDKLPDGGAQLRANRDAIAERLEHLKRSVPQVDPGASSQPIMTTAKNRLTFNARMLTTGAVEQLHSSLENCPTVDTLADDPSGLRVDLMRHQQRALAWMQWREQQKPSAGILADDMGLGKTLAMLSLVLSRKSESPKEPSEWMKKSTEGLVKCPGTLVVCPASLMMQWEGEVKSKLCPGTLRTNVYHGSNRIGFPHELAAYDLVITTYNIVGIEAASCADDEPQPAAPGKDGAKKKKRTSAQTTLFKLHWRRVILDEAHVIRNHKSGQSIGACKLKSDYRWAVTGTPIQNHLKDFYSLIKFIGLAPFDDFRVWKATVERKGTLGMQRLNTMVSSLVLRRTKEEMGKELAQLKLTNKMVETHRIKLAEEENRVYQVLFREARKVMYHWLQEQGEDAHLRTPLETGTSGNSGDGGPQKGNGKEETDEPDLPPEVAGLIMNVLRPCLLSSAKGRCVLALLLRLRQCCSHLQLLTRVAKPAEKDQDELELIVAMSALHLESGSDSQFSSDDLEIIPPEFTKEERSTKIKEVVRQLQKIRESDCDGPPQKSIIVSQWTSMLDIMQYHLDLAGISHVRIDGTVPPAKRNQFVNTFNSPQENPTVMLLSLQAGGVGLNLIGANHVFMLDMHWNPALEVQAADRCHRVGQKRDVFIHKFICEGTVEERILSLQEKKLSMAKNVLEGASERSRSNNKLSLNDLRHLFEID